MAEPIKETTKQLFPEKVSEVIYKNEYTHIVLTDDEIQYALYQVRKKKDALNRENEYWEKVRNGPEVLKLDNAQLQKYVMGKHKISTGSEFIKDEYNSQIFDLLTLYFNNDPMFETAGYSLKKGIMIFGGVGCGKTTLLKMFINNPKGSYNFVRCNDVASKFSEGGYEEVKKYFTPMKNAADTFGARSYGFCFDDLGTEKEKKYFGNSANIMEEILLNWYDLFLKQPERLHITTNLAVDEIEKLYGTRVRSRMREMFNVFKFNEAAPDRRK